MPRLCNHISLMQRTPYLLLEPTLSYSECGKEASLHKDASLCIIFCSQNAFWRRSTNSPAWVNSSQHLSCFASFLWHLTQIKLKHLSLLCTGKYFFFIKSVYLNTFTTNHLQQTHLQRSSNKHPSQPPWVCLVDLQWLGNQKFISWCPLHVGLQKWPGSF